MFSAVLPRLASPNDATTSQTPRNRIFGEGSTTWSLPGLRMPRAWMQWRKSSVVAVPHTTTIAARAPNMYRAPIIAAQRSLPSCAGLR